MDINSAPAYLPLIAYLGTVWAFQLRKAAVPLWLHWVAVITGVLVVGITVGPLAPVISLSFAAVFFVAAVFIAGRYLTRTGIITVSVAIAASPPLVGWLGIFGGILLAAIVSFILIAQSMGRGYATYTVYESMSSIGLGGGLVPTRPDETRIPATPLDELEQAKEKAVEDLERTSIRRRPRVKAMRLAPFMLVGVVAAAAYSVFF